MNKVNSYLVLNPFIDPSTGNTFCMKQLINLTPNQVERIESELGLYFIQKINEEIEGDGYENSSIH